MVCLEWTVKVVYRWKIRPSIPQNRVHLMIDGKSVAQETYYK
jgi:hypothetical protein